MSEDAGDTAGMALRMQGAELVMRVNQSAATTV